MPFMMQFTTSTRVTAWRVIYPVLPFKNPPSCKGHFQFHKDFIQCIYFRYSVNKGPVSQLKIHGHLNSCLRYLLLHISVHVPADLAAGVAAPLLRGQAGGVGEALAAAGGGGGGAQQAGARHVQASGARRGRVQ